MDENGQDKVQHMRHRHKMLRLCAYHFKSSAPYINTFLVKIQYSIFVVR